MTGRFEDLIAAGVVDPTKVTRTTLQNAGSITGLLLTSEALVSELSRNAPADPGPGHEHGMGGMMQAEPSSYARNGLGSPVWLRRRRCMARVQAT